MTRNNTIKDKLRDYRWLLRERDQLQEQLEKWQAKAYYASTSAMSGMPAVHGISSKTESYALKIIEIEEMICGKQCEVTEELMRIEDAIDRLRPLYRLILREHYMNGKVWEQIAQETGYSIQHIHRIHGWALQEIKLESL